MSETQKSEPPLCQITQQTRPQAQAFERSQHLHTHPDHNAGTMHKTILVIEGTAWNLAAGKG
ncbi:MAG: hypothetical protein U9N46_04325 [Euryarchaeota archaeon]|nr:hypothetical protein [Euryarchaeota archaeon]